MCLMYSSDFLSNFPKRRHVQAINRLCSNNESIFTSLMAFHRLVEFCVCAVLSSLMTFKKYYQEQKVIRNKSSLFYGFSFESRTV